MNLPPPPAAVIAWDPETGEVRHPLAITRDGTRHLLVTTSADSEQLHDGRPSVHVTASYIAADRMTDRDRLAHEALAAEAAALDAVTGTSEQPVCMSDHDDHADGSAHGRARPHHPSDCTSDCTGWLSDGSCCARDERTTSWPRPTTDHAA